MECVYFQGRMFLWDERGYLVLPSVTCSLSGPPLNLLEMVLALDKNEKKKKKGWDS